MWAGNSKKTENLNMRNNSEEVKWKSVLLHKGSWKADKS